MKGWGCCGSLGDGQGQLLLGTLLGHLLSSRLMGSMEKMEGEKTSLSQFYTQLFFLINIVP